LGAFFAPQKTGLSASIPRKPPRGLLRDFRCNPLRGASVPIVMPFLYPANQVCPFRIGFFRFPDTPFFAHW
jgi:hypothetical protein